MASATRAHAAPPQQARRPRSRGRRRTAATNSTTRKATWPPIRKPSGCNLRAERLRQRQHDAADQRAPQRAGAADDRRLEGEQQLRRAGIGIEGGAHAEERAGQADRDHGDRGGDGVGARARRCRPARRCRGLPRWRGSRGPARCSSGTAAARRAATTATTKISTASLPT